MGSVQAGWIGVAGAMLAAVPLVVAVPAGAADLDQLALPTFALTAPPSEPSPWTGLYVGSEVFAVSGGKGVRGGVGGGGHLGYNREFDNNWVLGVQAGAGYSPGVFTWAARGFNYASVEAQIGYDMGRLMPFVTVGGIVARPNGRPFGQYSDSSAALNDLIGGDRDLRGVGTVGAGFAYRLTPNTTVELAVQAYRGNALALP